MQNTPKKKTSRAAARRPKRRAPKSPPRPPAVAPSTNLPGFDDAKSSRPLAPDGFATAIEISRLIDDPALDDPSLRRLSDPAVAASRDLARGTTWLPRAIGARWQIGPDPTGRSPVWAGLHAHARHVAATRTGLAETYTSVADFCARTRFPASMLEYSIAHGSGCKDSGGRYHLTPFLDPFLDGANQPGGIPLLARIFSAKGQSQLGEDLPGDLNLEQEKAKLHKSQTKAIDLQYAIDTQQVVPIEEVKKLVQTEFLSPLRESFHALQKKIDRYPHLTVADIRADLAGVLSALAANHPATAQMIAARPPADPATDFNI